MAEIVQLGDAVAGSIGVSKGKDEHRSLLFALLFLNTCTRMWLQRWECAGTCAETRHLGTPTAISPKNPLAFWTHISPEPPSCCPPAMSGRGRKRWSWPIRQRMQHHPWRHLREDWMWRWGKWPGSQGGDWCKGWTWHPRRSFPT